MNTYANFAGLQSGLRLFDALKGLIESLPEQAKATLLDIGPRVPYSQQLGQWPQEADVWHALIIRQQKPLIALSLCTSYSPDPHFARGAAARVNPLFAKQQAETPAYDEAGWKIITRIGTDVKEWSGTVFETEKLDAVIDFIVTTLKAE